MRAFSFIFIHSRVCLCLPILPNHYFYIVFVHLLFFRSRIANLNIDNWKNAMTNATNALQEMRAKINANRKLLETQEDALLVMEQMMGLTSSAPINETKPLGNFKDGISIDTLNVHDLSNRKTLKQQVKDMVNLFGEQEFSVPHVFAAMQNAGIEIKGSQPKSRIATLLTELQGEGLIVKTFAGKGSVPHKFKLAYPS